MTLDEAIKHAEEVADKKNKEACNLLAVKNYEEARECIWCEEEHQQLAEWLKDYKRLREQEPILDKIRAEIEKTTSRYTISRERDALGRVEWSDRLIKESEVLQIINKYKAESEKKESK